MRGTRKSAFSAISSDFPLLKIGERAEHKGGRWWFNPPRNTFLKHVKAQNELVFDGGEQTRLRLNFSFVKLGMLPRVREVETLLIVLASRVLRQESLLHPGHHIDFTNGCPK